MIGTKPLYVALAQRKDVRRQALESQMQQRQSQRVAYSGGMGAPGYMGAPMYPYPPMNGYGGQPGMMPGMRGPMMGYPPQQMMQQARPRYAPAGQPGMNMPYGMPPPQMAYPGMPQYPVRPTNVGARPPTSAPNANSRSPVGAPQGLPAGTMPRGAQMPLRPPQGYPESGSSPQAGGQKLNAQSLARASPQDQKQMLGEALYPLIQE